MPENHEHRPVPLLLIIGAVMVTITVVEVLLGEFDRPWWLTGLLLAGEVAIGVVLAVAVWTAVTYRRGS